MAEEGATALPQPFSQLALEDLESLSGKAQGLIEAARGRIRGAHFGAYDYSSDCNISAMCQGMGHPACDFARKVMQVTLAGRPIHGWDIYSLPMNDPSKLAYTRTACAGACFYRATFKIEHPADAFLDTTQFTKGQVWLNGINLGRVWNVGPQNRLYVPGPWLRKGSNEIIVFDMHLQAVAHVDLPKIFVARKTAVTISAEPQLR